MTTLAIMLGDSWTSGRKTIQDHFPHAVTYDSGRVQHIYAWCTEMYGAEDAVSQVEGVPGDSTVFTVDLDGVWGHFDAVFWFKDAAHAMAFKLRWG